MPICCSIYFPGGTYGKESALNVKDTGSIPESGRSPEEGHANPLQYSCMENPTDRGAWRAAVHGVAESQTRLSDSAAAVKSSRRHEPLLKVDYSCHHQRLIFTLQNGFLG